MSFDRTSVRIGFGALLLVGVSGVIYLLALNQPPESEQEQQEVQTATVRQGDLVLFASGSGTLLAGREVELGFGTAGSVEQLLVHPGDQVNEGDLLATQGDRAQLEAAVAADELALLEAQQALDSLVENADLVAAQAMLELANAQERLEDEQSDWQYQQEGYRASSTTIKAAEAELKLAEDSRDRAKAESDNCGSSENPACAQLYKNFAAAEQRYWSALANLNWYIGRPTETQQLTLDAELALAEAELGEAQRAYDQVRDGPDPDDITAAELRVTKAEADLSISQGNLEDSILEAPFAGTVMEVTADAGDTVSGPFITLADLSLAQLEVFVDETDADKFSVGYEAEIIFDAIPDSTFLGEVIQVDPQLDSQGGVSTVRGMVLLDQGVIDGLLVGMNAAVDVIGGRAESVPLVPIEALRELSPGEYAVFVMQDGEPRLRPVDVGLSDFTFAEILTGLEVGEIVTTGIVETG
jgi:HlyD family secretion protein